MAEHLTPNFGLPYYEGGDPPNGAVQQQALATKVDNVLKPIADLPSMPIGSMMMWPVDAAPNDRWLLCNGSSYAISAYPTLGALLGESPAGSTNFIVPDLRTRFPVGAGSGFPLRAPGGDATVTLTPAQIPAHTHAPGTLAPAAAGSHSHGGVTQNNGPWPLSARATYGLFSTAAGNVPGLTTVQHADYRFLVVDEVPSHGHGITADGNHSHSMGGATAANAGGGQSHPNIPPCIAINFIILAK